MVEWVEFLDVLNIEDFDWLWVCWGNGEEGFVFKFYICLVELFKVYGKWGNKVKVNLRYYFYMIFLIFWFYKFICIFFVYCRENVGVLI